MASIKRAGKGVKYSGAGPHGDTREKRKRTRKASRDAAINEQHN